MKLWWWKLKLLEITICEATAFFSDRSIQVRTSGEKILQVGHKRNQDGKCFLGQ